MSSRLFFTYLPLRLYKGLSLADELRGKLTMIRLNHIIKNTEQEEYQPHNSSLSKDGISRNRRVHRDAARQPCLISSPESMKSIMGDYLFKNKSVDNLTREQKKRIRLLNVGYVFQDFRLFENDSVINNLLLPLDVLSND
jgi:hypothetical protein